MPDAETNVIDEDKSDAPLAEDAAPKKIINKEQVQATPAKEIGGRDGPDPTRYGDWEKNGRCIDF